MSNSSVITNRSLQLKNLRIERSQAPQLDNQRNRTLIICIPLLLLIAAALSLGGWLKPAPRQEPAAQSTVVPTSQAQLASANVLPINTPNASILDATGYVVARQAATVSATTTGKVVAVLIEEGMAIQEGEIMARLDDNSARAQFSLSMAQLNEAQAAARELRAQIHSKELEVSRARELIQKRLVSQSSFDQLTTDLDTLLAQSETANKVIAVSERRVDIHRIALDNLIIRAPFSGVVIKKSAQSGEIISPVSAGGSFTRTGIGTIVDMNSLEVEVDVSETYINRVKQDQDATIKLSAYPETTYAGRVLAVIPTADRNKATIRVRVGFLSLDKQVLPEMSVRVEFLQG